MMLNRKLWLSFEKVLTEADIQDIENRLAFLRDILEDAVTQYHVEDVSSELDLNLHIYLQYFCIAKNENLSPWLIHCSWFNYYEDGSELNTNLKEQLRKFYLRSDSGFYTGIKDLLECLDCYCMIYKEADAVTWLSLLDHLTSRLIYQMGTKRFQKIFGKSPRSPRRAG